MSSFAVPRLGQLDRRLLWVVGLGLAAVAVEMGLRGWEAHQAVDKELASVRSRAQVLASSDDGINWKARADAAEAERKAIQARLWRSPSEAQAQARLRDWLVNAMRTAAVTRASVNLLTPQPGGAAATLATPGPAPTAAAGSAASAATLPAAASVLRVRASVTFDLMPQALESALQQIEGGGQLARVDALSVSARARRVEMTVSVPVLLDVKEAR